MNAKLEARLKRQLEKTEFLGVTKYVELKVIYAPRPSTFWVLWDQAIEAMELQAAAGQNFVLPNYLRDGEDAVRELMEYHNYLKFRCGRGYWLSDLRAGEPAQANDTSRPEESSGCHSAQLQQPQTSTTQLAAPAPLVAGEPIVSQSCQSDAGQNGETPKAIRIAREVKGIFKAPSRGSHQPAKEEATRSARVTSKSPANQILRRNPNHVQPGRKLRQATQTKL